MIIRIFLLLLACAVLAFIAGDVLLRLRLPLLPELVTQLGLAVLLLAFGLLVISGLVLLGKRIGLAVAEYFSQPQTHLRRLWFKQNQQLAIAQRFRLQKLKLHFGFENQRQRLLKADNQRQINSLAKAVGDELRRQKKHLPKPLYRQWRQELLSCQHRQDGAGLLKLQQTITAWMPT
ncbi:hypothetical protein KFZ76_16125 [Methylovulum psychrotolerans]|uniref:hypothetical protein n=1 Tax=Methylovulum psychrotolerans TaxID=1704499 RepID=UPI001BFF880C|nr:hypothetical protein [Methylovulum psychrotolerans]MBT9099222.1 hypothetical protein [Methylovulum psychrotolerans]